MSEKLREILIFTGRGFASARPDFVYIPYGVFLVDQRFPFAFGPKEGSSAEQCSPVSICVLCRRKPGATAVCRLSPSMLYFLLVGEEISDICRILLSGVMPFSIYFKATPLISERKS